MNKKELANNLQLLNESIQLMNEHLNKIEKRVDRMEREVFYGYDKHSKYRVLEPEFVPVKSNIRALLEEFEWVKLLAKLLLQKNEKNSKDV